MDKLKNAVEKIVNKYADCLCSPWEDMQKEIFEVIDSERDEKALQNKLRLSQDAHIRDLNKNPILSYRSKLGSLYFELEAISDKMQTCLKGSVDYPAELSKEETQQVQIFLKEIETSVQEAFVIFVKMVD